MIVQVLRLSQLTWPIVRASATANYCKLTPRFFACPSFLSMRFLYTHNNTAVQLNLGRCWEEITANNARLPFSIFAIVAPWYWIHAHFETWPATVYFKYRIAIFFDNGDGRNVFKCNCSILNIKWPYSDFCEWLAFWHWKRFFFGLFLRKCFKMGSGRFSPTLWYLTPLYRIFYTKCCNSMSSVKISMNVRFV